MFCSFYIILYHIILYYIYIYIYIYVFPFFMFLLVFLILPGWLKQTIPSKPNTLGRRMGGLAPHDPLLVSFLIFPAMLLCAHSL